MNRIIHVNKLYPIRQFSSSVTLAASGAKSKRFENAVSLEEFIFRGKVKSIYRRLVRIVYKSHEKEELIKHVKYEFKLNSSVSDLTQRKYLLNDGINKINQMITMMNIQANKF